MHKVLFEEISGKGSLRRFLDKIPVVAYIKLA